MNKIDMKKIMRELKSFGEDLQTDAKRNERRLRELKSMQFDYHGVGLPILVMIAEIIRDAEVMKIENRLKDFDNVYKQNKNMIDNFKERLGILDEAQKQGIKVDNTAFESNFYEFVSRSEHIKLKGDEHLSDVIKNLEEKYNNIVDKFKNFEKGFSHEQ